MICKASVVATLTVMLSFAGLAHAQDGGPYKVLKIQLGGGDGGFDYVTTDTEGRNLYVARSGLRPHRRLQSRYADPGGRYSGRKRARGCGGHRDWPRICNFKAGSDVRLE